MDKQTRKPITPSLRAPNGQSLPAGRRGNLVKAIVIALLLISFPLHASVSSLQTRLTQLTSHLTDRAAVVVYSLDNDDVLFSKNPNTPLTPASTTKIFTSAAALKYLGPGYTFHTKFYLDPENDLYIEGYGNPSLVIEDMHTIVEKLAAEGIHEIKNIVVDDSYFENYTSPGLPQKKERYNFYTGALSLNFNRVMVHVRPAKRVGAPAQVKMDAGRTGIEVNNDVKTGGRKSGRFIELLPPSGENPELFIVKGQIPIYSKQASFRLHVPVPPLFAAQALKSLLKERGIKVTGHILRGEKTARSKLIMDHRSKPLYEILADLNKFSNNFIAEQLIKTLGARHVSPPGNMKKGLAVVSHYLKEIGIDPSSYNLVNGSGLTYENRLTANQHVHVIYSMYNSPELWEAFYNSLSIQGVDGSLKRRRNSKLLINRLHAKTGAVDFVKTIAGVVPAANGELLAFAVLLNDPPNIRNARKLQTQIGEALALFSR